MFFRSLNVLVWVTVAAAACGNPRTAENTERSIEEVLAAVRAYDAAWNGKDSAVVNQHLADQYQYFDSRGGVQSRDSLLAMHASPAYLLASSVRDELAVTLHHATVVVSSRWRGSGTYEEESFEDEQRCTLIWVSDDGTWRLLVEQCTNIDQPT